MNNSIGYVSDDGLFSTAPSQLDGGPPRTWIPVSQSPTTMKIKIKKLHPEAMVPVYATPGAANFDIFAIVGDGLPSGKPVVLSPGSQVNIRTGLAIEVPHGYVLEVFSRSGHGFKSGVRLCNSVGQVDSDYRGEVMVGLRNDGRSRFTVRHGDRIAQARIALATHCDLVVVDELSQTERGTGGFGSTGN